MVQSKVKSLQVDLQDSQTKCLKLETNLQTEKKRYESSDLGKVQNEIKTLKTKVVELEMNLNKEISEKNYISVECDRYRNTAQNLAKIVREHQKQEIEKIENTVAPADSRKTQPSRKMKKRNNKNSDRRRKMEEIKSQLSNLSLTGD